MEEKNIQNSIPETSKDVAEKKPKEKKKSLMILIIVLSILFLILGGYIVYTEFIQEPEKEEQTEVNEVENDTEVCQVGDEDCLEQDQQDVEPSEEDSYTTFQGEILSAKLPDGWSLVEYFDGEGTESLPTEMGNYYGLTAVDIINPDNKQVFTLQAVSGMGFVGCPNYALFEDDSPSYHAEQQSASDEMGETLNVVDYRGQEYIEFEFLDTTFRRIGEKYFYDMVEGNNYFEPPCVEGLLTLEGLYFTDEDGNIYEAYFYGPTEDATEADLLIVDDILQSIELI